MPSAKDPPSNEPSKPPKTNTLSCYAAVKSPIKTAVATTLFLSVSLVAILYYGSSTESDFAPEPTMYLTHLISDSCETNISHIAFGIAGSTQTWESRSKYSDLWWVPNSTRGFAFLEAEFDSSSETHRSSIPIRASSPGWTRYGSTQAVRVARVVLDLYRVGLPNVRWFVMGDDDTVFFPENLVTVLSGYDHREMVYVGGNSESVEQDVMHAYDMAFGGGGFAISYPLAVELARNMDGCLKRYAYFYGSDQRVWACLGEIGVGLSIELGFHQLDIRGDAFGLLSAHPLSPLTSLHHLDAVEPFFPNQTRISSLENLLKPYKLDPSRILQQCYCYHREYKWSISISWGYVVQIYPRLITAKELEMPLQTFKTWRSWQDGPFTFNTRLWSSDPCERPVIFYLDSVEEGSNNGGGWRNSVTRYRKFDANFMSRNCNRNYDRILGIDSVVVTAPKMDTREWRQGRRRHCCEILGSSGAATMKIGIRKCKGSETVTI